MSICGGCAERELQTSWCPGNSPALVVAAQGVHGAAIVEAPAPSLFPFLFLTLSASLFPSFPTHLFPSPRSTSPFPTSALVPALAVITLLLRCLGRAPSAARVPGVAGSSAPARAAAPGSAWRLFLVKLFS